MPFNVKINDKSISGKLKLLEELAQERVKDELKNIADSLVEANINGKYPIDTGAYILSHTFAATGGKEGRRYSSKGRPKGQNPQAKISEARSQLYSEIEAADITSSRTGIFRNRSPHGRIVEQKYSVYAQAKDRAR